MGTGLSGDVDTLSASSGDECNAFWTADVYDV
jgi:hypothetical protein